jgi:very-short-patch-repair endonuclease
MRTKKFSRISEIFCRAPDQIPPLETEEEQRYSEQSGLNPHPIIDIRDSTCYLCGAPAIRLLKVSKKPYCSPKTNGCPVSVKKLREYRINDYLKNSKIYKFKKEIKEGLHKCYMCGEIAKYYVCGKACCCHRVKACPKFKSYNRQRLLQWYIDNPQQREFQRMNTRRINNKPEVIQKKSDAMKYLHHQSREFMEKWKKGRKEKFLPYAQSPENRERMRIVAKTNFENPEFRRKYTEGLAREYNKSERYFFENFLEPIFGNLFRFNYKNENLVKVRNRRPDFVCEQLMIAINIDGFFHVKDRALDDRLIVEYMEKGWDLIIIKVEQMSDMDKLHMLLIEKINRLAGTHYKYDETKVLPRHEWKIWKSYKISDYYKKREENNKWDDEEAQMEQDEA